MPDLIHGVPVRLSDRVQRLTAPNPGPMTGAGTNTYLLGEQAIAVIDPGPLEQSHIDVMLEQFGDRIRWILATHTHPDHSPAVAPLAEATGAQVIGMLADDLQFQDQTFKPDWHMQHGEQLRSEEFCLTAIHTPGHVSNHLCFLLDDEGMLFAGDHVMNGSTVVIVPPGGDMKDYIESLQKLTQYPVACLAPAHGDLMDHPIETLQWLVDHRLGREAKVIDKLSALGDSAIAALVPVVYDDVDAQLHGFAQLSLLAHLIKLEREQRVRSEGEGNAQHWYWLG